MVGVAPAPATVLAQLYPVPVVVPVLLGDVVAPLALGTLKRHVDATVASHRCASIGGGLAALSLLEAQSSGRESAQPHEAEAVGPPVHARRR
jgi:hypothetical protein